MSEPWGGSLPLEVKDAIDDIFPGSEERRKIAYTLMFYNHKPSGDEMKKLAQAAGRSLRTAQEVARILSENSLFTSELGSVPLYKHIHSMGASRTLQGFGEAKPIGADAQPEEELQGEDEEPETQPIEPEDEAMDEDVDAELEAMKARAARPPGPIEKAMPSVLAVERLRDSFTKMSQRQDMLEVTVDKGFKEVLARLRAQEEAPALVPMVAANPLSVDPPDEEEVEQEPVNPGPVDEGPFAKMTKEQVLDMAINDPGMIYALRNQGVPPTSDTIQAVAHTTRWLALELTTYTQAAYERAVEDGYEGSLSDFINNAVYKYFADRGKVLQWVDVIPRQQVMYTQPSMYPRRPPS